MSAAVVRRVDHVNVRVSDPHPLFTALSDRLRLPVFWPVTRFPSFENGSVGLGNVTIEPTVFPGADEGGAGELFTICFEPEPVEVAAEEAERRGLSHSPPMPYVGRWPEEALTEIFHPRERTTEKQRLFTWLFFGGLMGDREMARRWSSRLYRSPRVASALGRAAGSEAIGPRIAAALAPQRASLFCCQWDGFDIDAAREQGRRALQNAGGGPLGVQSVREIVATTADLEQELPLWRALLEPAPETESGRWDLGDGPAVRLTAGDVDAITSLVLEVSSLEPARSFLDAEGMLGATSEGEVRIAPEGMFGLDLRLVAAGG